MSKLLIQYEELKKKNSKKIYIFKVGIFYNILNEDARLVSKEIGLKLTDLSPELIKCGFPLSALEKYTNLLSEHHIEFEVVSNPASSPQNTSYDNIIGIDDVMPSGTVLESMQQLGYDKESIKLKIKNILKK